MNKVMLLGNLAGDPEVRYLPTGTAVCEVSIAVNEQWVDDRTGEKKSETYFGRCVIWGPRGEAFAKFHKKGDKACVFGKLKNDDWEDKETGKKMSKTRIVVSEWSFCTSASSTGSGQSGQQQNRQRDYTVDSEKRRYQPPARTEQPRRPNDEFGDGPIQDGLEDQAIPF